MHDSNVYQFLGGITAIAHNVKMYYLNLLDSADS